MVVKDGFNYFNTILEIWRKLILETCYVLEGSYQVNNNKSINNTPSQTIMSTTNPVVKHTEWEPKEYEFFPKKTVSSKTGDCTTIPLLMASKPCDYQGNKKYTMLLHSPNPSYTTEATDAYFAKLQAFEASLIDDAVEQSEEWSGEQFPREIVKHKFNSFLKPSSKQKKRGATSVAEPDLCLAVLQRVIHIGYSIPIRIMLYYQI